MNLFITDNNNVGKIYMEIDINRVVQKLTAQLSQQAVHIAALQVQLEQLEEQLDDSAKEGQNMPAPDVKTAN